MASLWLLELHCLGDYYASYWPTTHPLATSPVICILARWADGSECLVPAIADFYWRRDMSSGVKWPRSAGGLCEVKAWEGWSDSKGAGVVHLSSARGGVAGNDQKTSCERCVDDVVRGLERQLQQTFLGTSQLRWLKRQRAELVIRARVLERDGMALRAKVLWEHAVGGVE